MLETYTLFSIVLIVTLLLGVTRTLALLAVLLGITLTLLCICSSATGVGHYLHTIGSNVSHLTTPSALVVTVVFAVVAAAIASLGVCHTLGIIFIIVVVPPITGTVIVVIVVRTTATAVRLTILGQHSYCLINSIRESIPITECVCIF